MQGLPVPDVHGAVPDQEERPLRDAGPEELPAALAVHHRGPEEPEGRLVMISEAFDVIQLIVAAMLLVRYIQLIVRGNVPCDHERDEL